MDAEIRRERAIRQYLWCAGTRTQAIVVFSLLTLLTPSLPVQSQQPQSANPAEYHIEAVVLAQWKPGTRHLSDKAFTVEQDGREYPTRVSQPLPRSPANALDYPTHMMLIFPPDEPRPNYAAVVNSLRKTLSQGWLVSVTRSDGKFTPYCDSVAALSSALAASSTTALSTQQAIWMGQDALIELENFPGRRVLLFSGKMDASTGELPLAYFGDEPKDRYLIPQVYFLDGGEFKPTPFYPRDMTTPHEIRWMSSTFASGSRTDADGTMQRAYHLGTAHEKSLSQAVTDALRDAHNYYDLEFAVPVAQPPSTGPMTLTLHRRTETHLSAQLYTVSSRKVDSTTIETRHIQPLLVVKK
jgi:hypothetical protein